jgi:hypothetical protein
MFSLINLSSMFKVQRARLKAVSKHCTLNVEQVILAFAIVALTSCTQQKIATTETFLNFDSLINTQLQRLENHGYELNKSVQIDGKQEDTRFVPDSAQWASELEIFRQLDAVNKASFRNAYVVSDTRDTNSNLTIREIKAEQDAPVSLVRLYYLRTPADIRKIEATWFEETALYTNTRRMIMEFESIGTGLTVNRYRVEGFQKMVMDDSVHFIIAGQIGI